MANTHTISSFPTDASNGTSANCDTQGANMLTDDGVVGTIYATIGGDSVGMGWCHDGGGAVVLSDWDDISVKGNVTIIGVQVEIQLAGVADDLELQLSTTAGYSSGKDVNMKNFPVHPSSPETQTIPTSNRDLWGIDWPTTLNYDDVKLLLYTNNSTPTTTLGGEKYFKIDYCKLIVHYKDYRPNSGKIKEGKFKISSGSWKLK